jgi:hypothetical protein
VIPAAVTNCGTSSQTAPCGADPDPSPVIDEYCKVIAAASKPSGAAKGGRVTLKIKNEVRGIAYKWTLAPNRHARLLDAGRAPAAEVVHPFVVLEALSDTGDVTVKVETPSGKTAQATVKVARVTITETTDPAKTTYGFDNYLTFYDNTMHSHAKLQPYEEDIALAGWVAAADLAPVPLPRYQPRTAKPRIPLSTPSPYIPHISIEMGQETHVHVHIDGADASDFHFWTDRSDICGIPDTPAGTDFDLRLTGNILPNADGSTPPSAETTLRIRCNGYPIDGIRYEHSCDCNADENTSRDFARVKVHVYEMKVVPVLIAKVEDGTSIGTFITARAADYTVLDHDKRLRPAVLSYDMQNANGNAPLHIPFDPAGTAGGVPFYPGITPGRVDFNPSYSGTDPFSIIGSNFEKIDSARNPMPDAIRVAIVRDLRSFFVLKDPYNPGAPRIKITARNVSYLFPMNGVTIGTQTVNLINPREVSDGTWVDIDPPHRTYYPAGTELDLHIAGWSTNPILISERSCGGNANEVLGVILHEVGHNPVGFKDVDDVSYRFGNDTVADGIMHWTMGGSSTVLRHLPRPFHYQNSVPATGGGPAPTEESHWKEVHDPMPGKVRIAPTVQGKTK